MESPKDISLKSAFEEVPDVEADDILSQVYRLSISMTGRSSKGGVVVFQPRGKHKSFLCLEGEYRCSGSPKKIAPVTFSFVYHDNKYLFQARFERIDDRIGELHLLTGIYKINRRQVKRLKLPIDFYAVLRITHVNSRWVKGFAKLSDVSLQGVGLLLPTDELKIKSGDCINIVLSIRQRPPENIELRIVHRRSMPKVQGTQSGKGQLVFLGAVFIPENSALVSRKVQNIVMDIYRDIFGSLMAS